MCKTIPTFYLYGLDAIPADVIVQGDVVRVVERGTGRTLVDVKQESDTRKQAGVQSGGPSPVRRKPAPADLKKGRRSEQGSVLSSRGQRIGVASPDLIGVDIWIQWLP